MGSYGIKVARAGIPVTTAADNQLLYSSSFPTTNIVASGTVGSGSNVTHNLGYAPAFMFTAQFTDNTAFFGGKVNVDTTKLYNTIGATIQYYIFGRDIRTNLTGVNINQSAASSVTPNQSYGFKVSKDGKDVKTAGLSDLVSFSGLSASGQAVRQLIIHQSEFHDNIANGATVNYSHNLGYVPLFFPFVRQNGGSNYFVQYIDTSVNGLGYLDTIFQVSISSTQITFVNNYGYAIDIGFIIFKDPF